MKLCKLIKMKAPYFYSASNSYYLQMKGLHNIRLFKRSFVIGLLDIRCHCRSWNPATTTTTTTNAESHSLKTQLMNLDNLCLMHNFSENAINA
jgi:hypothetical protein